MAEQRVPLIDIRDGEQFVIDGTTMKSSITDRIKGVLLPASDASFDSLLDELEELEPKQVAALLVALLGDPAEWNGTLTKINHDVHAIIDLRETIENLQASATSFSSDAKYVLNREQLMEYGIGVR